MKKRRGGARVGAGRPKKADEVAKHDAMFKAMEKVHGNEYEYWLFYFEKAKDCTTTFKVITDHYYGKPVEKKPDIDPNEGKEKTSSVTLIM